MAVKELHPPGNDQDRLRQAIRLARELRVWAGLLHPNILPLVGYHLSDDMTIARLISPFESNGQLFDYFRRASPNEAERLQLVSSSIDVQIMTFIRSPASRPSIPQTA